jgi:hypothetical protein
MTPARRESGKVVELQSRRVAELQSRSPSRDPATSVHSETLKLCHSETTVPSDRRGWLAAAFRWTLLSLMATVTTVLLARRPGRNDCWNLQLCDQCRRANDCQLPAAAQWRERTG